MIYAYFALALFLVAALVLRLAWPRLVRTFGQASPGDRAAIDRFLANRDETAAAIEKEFWRSGFETRFAKANIYGVPQGGRFYRVLGSDAGGRTYRHALAVAGDPAQLGLTVFQQESKGYWTQVLQ